MRNHIRKLAAVGAVVATLGRNVAVAQGWEARYPPHADCRLAVQRTAGGAQSTTRTGDIVIHPVWFASHEDIHGVLVGLAPIGQANPAAKGRAWTSDTATRRIFPGLHEGKYSLVVRGLGVYPRTDTIQVRPGGVDTIVVPLESFEEGYRNVQNCRPRGFRRDRESACIISGSWAEGELEYGRDLAGPERGGVLGLP